MNTLLHQDTNYILSKIQCKILFIKWHSCHFVCYALPSNTPITSIINVVIMLGAVCVHFTTHTWDRDFFCITLTSLNLYLRAQCPFAYVPKFLLDYSCIRTIASRLAIALNLFPYHFTNRHTHTCAVHRCNAISIYSVGYNPLYISQYSIHIL